MCVCVYLDVVDQFPFSDDDAHLDDAGYLDEPYSRSCLWQGERDSTIAPIFIDRVVMLMLQRKGGRRREILIRGSNY